MPIVAADLLWFLSGGVGNTDPNASLGGVRSTTQIVDDTTHNLFGPVTGDQSASGITKYRGIYFFNNHGSLTLQDTKVWIQSQTTSADTALAIALADEGLNNTMETIADEFTAPAGPTFSAPANKAAGLDFGDIPTVNRFGLWVRLVVDVAADAYADDTTIIRAEGDTEA